MKTNITTDNYEAYLLDYLEGNLSHDEAEQLKTFVAAQGLDWDELTEELPHLEASVIAFQGKEKLKKKAAVVPLYVKIASAAAAAGLLLTVTLWPEKQLPKVEPIAGLRPIEVSRIDAKESFGLLPRRATESIDPLLLTSLRRDDMLSKASSKGNTISERESVPLLAELPTKTVNSVHSDLALADTEEPNFEFMARRMNAHLEYAQYEANDYPGDADDERELSWIGKTIYMLTDGRHDSFASLFGSGVRKAKQDLSNAATDAALTAYYRAEERWEDTMERWEEKLGE